MLLMDAFKFTCNWVIDPLVYFITMLIQSSFLITLGVNTQNTDKKDPDLFPASSNFVKLETKDQKSAVRSGKDNKNTLHKHRDNAKPCSTSTMSMFVPTKNEAGEYEFKLANVSEENSIPYSTRFKPNQLSLQNDVVVNNNNNGFINLSPVSSVKSIDSNNSLNINTTTAESGESGDSEGNESSDGTEKMYQCSHCDSKFKCKSYLTRHVKKHSDQKAYRCPFFKDDEHKCHQTGGFSRRDTFKTHLKSRHFEYPPGVKSNKRTGMMGWCGICGEKFLNNEIWVERHIDMGLCPGLPGEYIKNLKIGKKKTGKHSKFLDVSNIDESIRLGIQTQGKNNNDTNNNFNVGMNHTMYLQSPSSINSSPPNGLMNNSSVPQVSATLPTNTSQVPYVPSIFKPSTPAIPSANNTNMLPVDLETLELLQKQHELTNIITTLKRKQEEAETRTQVAKHQYENQLQNQMKQLQFQHQLMQLQQMQGFQQALQPHSSAYLEQYQSLEEYSQLPTPSTHTRTSNCNDAFVSQSNGNDCGHVKVGIAEGIAADVTTETTADSENNSEDEYPSLE